MARNAHGATCLHGIYFAMYAIILLPACWDSYLLDGLTFSTKFLSKTFLLAMIFFLAYDNFMIAFTPFLARRLAHKTLLALHYPRFLTHVGLLPGVLVLCAIIIELAEAKPLPYLVYPALALCLALASCCVSVIARSVLPSLTLITDGPTDYQIVTYVHGSDAPRPQPASAQHADTLAASQEEGQADGTTPLAGAAVDMAGPPNPPPIVQRFSPPSLVVAANIAPPVLACLCAIATGVYARVLRSDVGNYLTWSSLSVFLSAPLNAKSIVKKNALINLTEILFVWSLLHATECVSYPPGARSDDNVIAPS